MFGPHTGPLPHLWIITVKNATMKQSKGRNGDLKAGHKNHKEDYDELDHRYWKSDDDHLKLRRESSVLGLADTS